MNDVSKRAKRDTMEKKTKSQSKKKREDPQGTNFSNTMSLYKALYEKGAVNKKAEERSKDMLLKAFKLNASK